MGPTGEVEPSNDGFDRSGDVLVPPSFATKLVLE